MYLLFIYFFTFLFIYLFQQLFHSILKHQNADSTQYANENDWVIIAIL